MKEIRATTALFKESGRFAPFASLAIFALLICCSTVFAQTDKKAAEQLKKQQEREAKAAEAAAKRQEKEERRYQSIKKFAENAYTTDLDFREQVNYRFRTIRKRHSDTAYYVNMRPSNMKLVRQEGDKVFFDDTLYANPLAQDFVNRVGQSLVPRNSPRLYSFKILQNPVPEAKAMSNGTIYITTGYLSIIDNEAQLAYLLGHEIAHVENDHWFHDVLVDLATPAYHKRNPWKSLLWSIQDAKDLLINPDTYLTAKLNQQQTMIGWEPYQEDEADREALKYMSERNYDVREVPKLYDRLKQLTSDPRSQTGFIADPDRINERTANFARILPSYVKSGAVVGAVDLALKRNASSPASGSRGLARILSETLTPEIQRKLEAGELMASSEEFQSTIALVKRDNGIRALQFDMFALARNNLEDSIAIRSNDPYAYYYFGQALKLTARNAAETSRSLSSLNQAIAADKRQTIAEPYLYRAMLRLGERNPNEAQAIAKDLSTYVEIYQRENGGQLPPNMEFVYDVMQDFDVLYYRAVPVENSAEAPKPIIDLRSGSASAVAAPAPTPASTPVPTATPSRTRRP